MMRLNARACTTDLLALLAALQGLATLAIDLTRTHAKNPEWLGHARFHVVWQSANVALFAMLTEYVLWTNYAPEEVRFHLAALMTAIPMLGFLAALFPRRAYGGTLYDSNGIRPLVITFRGSRLEIDLNLVAVITGLAVLSVLLLLHDLYQ